MVQSHLSFCIAQPKNLDVLRKLFTDPDALRPGLTTHSVTSLVGEKFGLVADAMRVRSVPPQEVAHFLMKLMFSMFAEDIDLLPNRVFSRTLKQSKNVPAGLSGFLRELFAAMASGGTFALEDAARHALHSWTVACIVVHATSVA